MVESDGRGRSLSPEGEVPDGRRRPKGAETVYLEVV